MDYNRSRIRFKCNKYSCSPFAYYFLHRIEKKEAVRDEVIDKLTEYAKYSMECNLISHLFHFFIQFYAETLIQKGSSHQIGKQLIGYNKFVLFMGGTLRIKRWCARIEMVRILREQSNNLRGVKDGDEVKKIWWKLLGIFERDLRFISDGCADKIREIEQRRFNLKAKERFSQNIIENKF